MKNKPENHTKIKSKFKYFIFLCIYFVLYPVSKIIYGNKNKWLICERGVDAQDNGFVFFKYLIDNHPTIKPVFLLNKNSKEYEKVSKIGKTVNYGSVRHFLMVIGCPVKISSNIFGYAPWVQMATYFRRNQSRDCHVFLQHGIIKNSHEGLFKEACASLKLFVCGAKPEYDYIFNEFGYKNNVPCYTGLARYDLLMNFNTSDQIVFMPTWRASLSDFNDSEFMNSSFFACWCSLINNKILLQYCKDNNLIIKFYLHIQLQKFSHLFKDNEVFKVVNYGETTVQNLLKESKILVTDFSSVFFDFAYMRKPVVYFQFDEATFNKEHYAKGYFDYRRDGFGDVCSTTDDVVNSISKVIKNNFSVEEKYLNRMNSNFIYRDDKNCERIFERIREIQEKR